MGTGTLVDTVDAYAAVGVDRLILPPRPETSRALGLTA